MPLTVINLVVFLLAFDYNFKILYQHTTIHHQNDGAELDDMLKETCDKYQTSITESFIHDQLMSLRQPSLVIDLFVCTHIDQLFTQNAQHRRDFKRGWRAGCKLQRPIKVVSRDHNIRLSFRHKYNRVHHLSTTTINSTIDSHFYVS